MNYKNETKTKLKEDPTRKQHPRPPVSLLPKPQDLDNTQEEDGPTTGLGNRA